MPQSHEPRMCLDAVPAPENRDYEKEVAQVENPANAPGPLSLERLVRVASIEPPLAAVLLSGKRWAAGRTITVSFLDGSASLHRRVRAKMVELQQYANLDLQFITSGGDIRITFTRGGSWSYVGTDNLLIPKGEPTMQLGWLNADSPEDELNRVVKHETMHAFGFGHEQGHPEGGIPWDKPKVYDYYARTQGWSRAQVDAQVFQKYAETQTNYSAYDPKSIMHYPVDTELTIGDFEIGFNSDLSATDKEYLGRWYPFREEPGEPEASMENLLVVQGKGALVEYSVHISGPARFVERAGATIQGNDSVIDLPDGSSLVCGSVSAGKDAIEFDGSLLSTYAQDGAVTFVEHREIGG